MTAKIADLGMARMLLNNIIYCLTKTPDNLAFVAPEVMTTNARYDTSADVFSFGIIIIHILSGKWPEPQCPQTVVSPDGYKMIPVSEADRREVFLQDIGADHPAMELLL